MKLPQGYKQTELGIIPEDWEISTIRDRIELLTDFDANGSFADVATNVTTYDGDGYAWYVRATDLERNPPLSQLKYVDYNSYRFLKKSSLYGSEVLLTKRGEIGKVYQFKTRTKYATLAPNLYLLKFKEKINSTYLFYFLKSDLGNKQLRDINATTSLGALYKEDVKNVHILCPNIKEQQIIAEALSDVDALIAALDRKIAKKRLIKQSAMQQLLTGKKRLPGFTDKWQYVHLGKLLEYEQPTKYLVAYAEYEKTGTPVLTAGKTFILGYTSETMGIYNTVPVIIFDDFTTDSKYVTIPFKAKSSAMKMLQLRDSRYSLRLIFELMQIIQFPLYDHQRYWISEYSKLQVYIPTNFEEQQAIATILSDMDKEIADLEARRDKYKLIKSGMMQKLLTGQIRLIKPLAPIIPLAVPETKIREIPLQTHIVAGHIVNTLYQSSGWGRTKLQKTLHLVGYHCQLDFGNEYIRNTAGPDDQAMMNHIDSKFKQYRHVKIEAKKDNDKTRYNYIPTAMIDELEQVYETYPQTIRDAVDALINKIKKMDLARAEIVSTLYAVWNNRIIKEEQISDDLLLADFYAWSKHKSDFSRDLVLRGLNYMRKEGIIPVGWGKYIDKK